MACKQTLGELPRCCLRPSPHQLPLPASGFFQSQLVHPDNDITIHARLTNENSLLSKEIFQLFQLIVEFVVLRLILSSHQNSQGACRKCMQSHANAG